MEIEVWSDVICPFCYIGKRKLEVALEQTGLSATLHWRSFELNPMAPPSYGIGLLELFTGHYGMSQEQALGLLHHEEQEAARMGLAFDWQAAQPGSTFHAHRLLKLAASQGLADAVQERFMRAYFSEGARIGDAAVLQHLAEEAGLAADAVASVLQGKEYTQEVRADQRRAQELGIRGVPYFLINGQVAVSGARDVAEFVDVLQSQRSPGTAGEQCADGRCDLPS